MGSMAPTDCSTPALAVGSNLLRWADVYGRQNRGVKGYFLSGPPGLKTCRPA